MSALPNAHEIAELLTRYDKPGPRYTSYPTAVEFTEDIGPDAYERKLVEAARSDEPLSLYLHLPFCSHRCAFCGCHVVITTKHQVATDYLDVLHREIDLVADRLGDRVSVRQYHWGGGTPTFLTVEEMEALHRKVTSRFRIEPDAEVAIEVDPRVTTDEQLRLLQELGFNRISMGVQDFTPEVQDAITRWQTEEQTVELVEKCRRLGFDSPNLDLIYGLPKQSPDTFIANLEKVIALLRRVPDVTASPNFTDRVLQRLPSNRVGVQRPGFRVTVFAFAASVTFLCGVGVLIALVLGPEMPPSTPKDVARVEAELTAAERVSGGPKEQAPARTDGLDAKAPQPEGKEGVGSLFLHANDNFWLHFAKFFS